jgi:CO/xanthine dehydrogenase FAD-binding subunit
MLINIKRRCDIKTIKPFTYHNPKSVIEAASLLIRYENKVKIIAGGTDLMVMMKDRILTPENIINIKSITGLDQIFWNEREGLTIGALTKISEIVNSDIIAENYPSLQKSAEVLGSPQVRNMATIGGNICRSSPSADTIPSLIIYDARLRLTGTEGEREVPIEKFFTGPGINVINNEILTEILLPPVTGVYGTAFGKISRLSEDLAKVNCAVKINLSDNICTKAKIVLGAVAPMPVRAKNVEQVLEGHEITDRLIETAAAKISEDITPIDDVRSTAEYRYRAGRVLIRRLLKEAAGNVR